jgi:hypothetical protein
MSDVERYLTVARLDAVDRVFFWERWTDPPDRIVLDDAGMVLAFPSEQAAREAAAGKSPELSVEEGSVYDLDTVDAWCKSSDTIGDCAHLLDAWNLLADLPRYASLFTAADARLTAVYDKLFRGCNLPATTPDGEHYVPVWTASETAALKHMLLLGLAELRARLP